MYSSRSRWQSENNLCRISADNCLFLCLFIIVQLDLGSEEEEGEDIVCIPAEKSKVASLEKMIALIATLVEKSRDESNSLRLSTNDWNALTGGGKVLRTSLMI